MTKTATATSESSGLEKTNAAIFESLAIKGDISGLNAEQKTVYLERLCKSIGVNPLTQPFTPLKLNGKEVLYASRACTDQLAGNRGLTREIIKTERVEDVFIVTCRVSDATGRFDVSTGAVTIGSLKGDGLANALMKAETKAKRRGTLAFCGLGFLDEAELDTIPTAPRPATKKELTTTDVPPEVDLGAQIIAVCHDLNEAKDSIEWKAETFLDYVGQLFDNPDIKSSDDLTIEQKQFLIEDLQERLRLLKDNS